MTTVSCAVELPELSQSSANPSDEDLSPDIARDLYADALALKRGELPWIVGEGVLGLLGAVGFIVAPRQFATTAVAAVAVLGHVGQWIIDGYRLLTTDAVTYYRRERLAERSRADAVAAHQLRLQRTRLVTTWGLFALIATVTLVEFVGGGAGRAVMLAGLVKPLVREGQWWRLLTASYIHADLWHITGNLGALIILGQLVESYGERLRVPLAYLAGVIGGGAASVLLTPAPSLGASGGVLALAGYLLVAFYREPGPHGLWLRQRIVGWLGMMALLGVVGMFAIDNAAHAGGFLAGVLTGLVTVPRAGHSLHPRTTRVLDGLSGLAAALLIAGALFTARILG